MIELTEFFLYGSVLLTFLVLFDIILWSDHDDQYQENPFGIRTSDSLPYDDIDEEIQKTKQELCKIKELIKKEKL